MPSSALRMSAETSPELRPNALASMLISRFRSRRLIWFGPVDARHVGHLRKPHRARHAVGSRRHVDRNALQVGDRDAAVGAHAHVDVVVLAVRRAPVADRRAGDERAQAAREHVDVQADVGGRVALHVDRDRWLVGLQGRVEIDQPGDRLQLRHDHARQPLELDRGRAPAPRTAGSCRRRGRSGRCS